jgi:hypothetical protein
MREADCPFSGKPRDLSAVRLETRCEYCGTRLETCCQMCGAPVCCPRCCREMRVVEEETEVNRDPE